MDIERIEEMRLTAKDEAQIGSLLDSAFGTDFAGRSYYQQRHHVRLLVREADKIIGHVAIDLRAIRMGDAIVQVAGLAEVATATSHRGQGLASSLLDAAILEVRQTVSTFLLLFGDHPIYARKGFMPKQNILRYTSFVGVKSGVTIEAQKDGLMVLLLSDLSWDDDAMIDLVGHAF